MTPAQRVAIREAIAKLEEALAADALDDPPAPTETLVHRGTVTLGPEPDGSVRQATIVGACP